MGLVLSGDAVDPAWAHHIGDDLLLISAKFILSPEDII